MRHVHAVLVTHRRPVELRAMLRALGEQSLDLTSLIVVDNDPEPTEHDLVAGARPVVAERVEYLPTGENLGPAGALARGMEAVLDADADDDDWILLLDDDDPPAGPDTLDQVLTVAERCAAHGPRAGGAGRTGARFDARRGTVRRLRDDELRGDVAVDYLGGGHFPFYRVAAVRDVGVPDPELFFGFDDLEYGLRLGRAGWSLHLSGEDLLVDRQRKGRIGLGADLASTRTAAFGWRDHYAHRNLIHILRTQGASAAAARRSATVLAKAALNLPRTPKASATALRGLTRATVDGWRGRLGRTVDPDPS